ncbi:MAG: hypothetical protein K0R54_1203 [Clostridiaceae bacterium]|nr:hypothetical protein [Clostridiaceae bacterium]
MHVQNIESSTIFERVECNMFFAKYTSTEAPLGKLLYRVRNLIKYITCSDAIHVP